jgi:hypothetical protein
MNLVNSLIRTDEQLEAEGWHQQVAALGPGEGFV